ncbi:hypothetical protein K501DRAFT_270547 [Backusella circina FSU 941]|nr:hypothetical protein K501DRAFT_270547 [Backusella circina FSU 941]
MYVNGDNIKINHNGLLKNNKLNPFDIALIELNCIVEMARGTLTDRNLLICKEEWSEIKATLSSPITREYLIVLRPILSKKNKTKNFKVKINCKYSVALNYLVALIEFAHYTGFKRIKTDHSKLLAEVKLVGDQLYAANNVDSLLRRQSLYSATQLGTNAMNIDCLFDIKVGKETTKNFQIDTDIF